MRNGRAGPAFILCFLSLLLLPLPAGAAAGDFVRDFAGEYAAEALSGPVPYGNAAEPVALVGQSRITAGDVMELWTPVWSETQARVRNGRLTARAGDLRLQDEWEKAVTALVKDEVFFQEADREHASMINAYVGQIMRGGADMPWGEVLAQVRRQIDRDMQRYFNQLNADIVRESGGRIKLGKVLESRGMTFADWQNRLRKKAFTQSYLGMILSPRAPDPGPKQVQEYYAAHAEEFSRPGTVRFRHIFFSNAARGPDAAREDAAEVWEMIAANETTFEEAARTYTDDAASKDRGGLETEAEASDLEREAWLSDIRAALREEKPGEPGPILESPFGFHVAVLLDIGPARKIPFAEVRAEIERKLSGEVWEAATDRYFSSVVRNTPVRILRPSFPPQLSCAAQQGAPQRGPRVVNTARPEIGPARRGR